MAFCLVVCVAFRIIINNSIFSLWLTQVDSLLAIRLLLSMPADDELVDDRSVFVTFDYEYTYFTCFEEVQGHLASMLLLPYYCCYLPSFPLYKSNNNLVGVVGYNKLR